MARPSDTSLDSQPALGGVSALAAESVAGLMALVWCVAVAAYVWMAPAGTGALGLVLTLLVVVLPLGLILASVTTLRSIRVLRTEAAGLRANLDAMRAAQADSPKVRPSAETTPDAVVVTARQSGTVSAGLTSRRDQAQSQPTADRKAALALPVVRAMETEPALALGTPAEDLRAPLSVADFIRALQFPETAEDREGLRALRLALDDRSTAKLIRAAQDVLTLLSKEGIYMDDLVPDRARPAVWRRFAAGERGRAIAALGGVRDRSSLALTAARMREDTVFRDAGHHFMRSFDKTFAAFEPNATDEDLAALADTRTARAFMLFGRVTGTFD